MAKKEEDPKWDDTEPTWDDTEPASVSQGEQAMADMGINPSAADAKQQLANRSATKGPIDTGQQDALVRGLGKGVTLGQQAPLAGLGAAAMQGITGNQSPV